MYLIAHYCAPQKIKGNIMSTAQVYFVTYNNAGVTGQRIEGKTPEEILAIFRTMYKELEKADVQVDGDQVSFVLRDGNKAASTVYFVTYNNAGVTGQRIEGKTPEEILAIFRTMYKELEKADVQVDGDQVSFVLRDGNKAA